MIIIILCNLTFIIYFILIVNLAYFLSRKIEEKSAYILFYLRIIIKTS